MTDTALQQLVDRVEIVELHNTYAALLDSGRAAEVPEAVCTPDAVWDHGTGRETVRGFDGIREFLLGMTSRFEGTMHALSNVSIRFRDDGQTADSRVYLQAYHWLAGSGHDGARPADFITTGVYVDVLTRTEHGWRIAERLRRSVGPSPVGVGALPAFMTGIGG